MLAARFAQQSDHPGRSVGRPGAGRSKRLEERAEASPIIHHFLEDEPKVAYTNLTSYMPTMAAAIDRDALWWKGTWWEVDLPAIAAVHAGFDPGIDFPYFVGE